MRPKRKNEYLEIVMFLSSISPPLCWRVSAHWGCRAWQNFPQQIIHPQAPICSIFPLARISKTDLLESTTFIPIRSTNMKMTTDNHLGIEPSMPISCQCRAAPYDKSWNVRQVYQFLSKRPVIRNYKRQRGVLRFRGL